MVPCLIREDTVMDEVDGQVRTYCSETCHWTDKVAFRPEYEGRPTPSMGRLSGMREWETLHHGKDLADIISDLGYVRDDGQTLDPAAASEPRSEEDVDARRGQGHHAQQPQRAPQRDVARGARGPHRALQARRGPAPGARPDAERRHGDGAARGGAGGRSARLRPPPIATMGKTHTVRFEPVGIEMEVDEDETILDAAFRQGIMLMHGCKEGQCSACKSFLLDGDVDLDSYSTFALPDFEEAEGWTLLCRAHAYSDLEVELHQLRRGESSTAARRRGRSPRR